MQDEIVGRKEICGERAWKVQPEGSVEGDALIHATELPWKQGAKNGILVATTIFTARS